MLKSPILINWSSPLSRSLTSLKFLFVLFIIVNHLSAFALAANAVTMPSFDRSNENVTVIIGSAAVLPCFISNLGDHKVAWIKVANTDVLAIGDYKVTNDDRIKIVHGYVTDWSLSIQPVSEEDSGEYICQINTEPPKITKINLQVLLPPKIIEEKSTISPGPILEGESLTLFCHTEGIPKPKVSWFFRRRASSSPSGSSAAASAASSSHHHHHSNAHDHRAIIAQHSSSSGHHQHFKNGALNHDQVLQEGDRLVIKNVSRFYSSGVFECIANNSVPPAASRKIRVSVEYAPELHVHQERVEQMVGQDARFECRIRANPLNNHYWMKDGRVIEASASGEKTSGVYNEIHGGGVESSSHKSGKYEIITYNQNSHENLIISALVVKNITKGDFGLYQCFAVNSHNISKVDVELKEIQVRRAPSTKSTVSRILIYNGDASNGKLTPHDQPKMNTKLSSLSKQQRKTNTSVNKLSSSKSDADYFEHDLSENTLTLINSGVTGSIIVRTGVTIFSFFSYLLMPLFIAFSFTT